LNLNLRPATRRVLKAVAILAALPLLLAICAGMFWVVIPSINEHRIHDFCDQVQAGENAEALWNRGGSFERQRGANEMDFSVSLPSLFIRVWHCNVSLDGNGAVATKTLGCED
jgi:hypothetical protein